MRLREAGQGCGQTQVSVGLATAGVGARVKYLEFLAFLGFGIPFRGCGLAMATSFVVVGGVAGGGVRRGWWLSRAW